MQRDHDGPGVLRQQATDAKRAIEELDLCAEKIPEATLGSSAHPESSCGAIHHPAEAERKS